MNKTISSTGKRRKRVVKTPVPVTSSVRIEEDTRESIPWTLFDTILLPANTLISAERSFDLFVAAKGATDSSGTRKTSEHTNMNMASTLPMPQSFDIWSLDINIIGPTHAYERELSLANISHTLYIGCKSYSTGLLVNSSNVDVNCKLDIGMWFSMQLRAVRDFYLQGNITISARLKGRLYRSIS